MPKTKRRKARAKKAAAGLTFNHAMAYVKDVARAMHFYVDLLGFKVLEEFRNLGSPVYARIRSPHGDSTIALHKLEPGKTLSAEEGIRLYFEVRDLNGFCAKLKARGVTLLQEPKMMPWGWTHAYLNDPDGHELSLYWAGANRLRKTSS